MARGATSWATYKNAGASTEAACSPASAASRGAGSKVWRAFVTSSSNLGLLIKPQLCDTGGAIEDDRKRTRPKNGSIVEMVTLVALEPFAVGSLAPRRQLVNSVFHSMTSSWTSK